jgi:catechol 2,3-dioxygenase-like lactoylglutathione lyase family enzyme
VQVKGLNHAALLVSDVEASRQFYGGVLGMEEVRRPSNFDFPGAWFRKGTAELHLIGEPEPGRVRQVQPGYAPEEVAAGYGAHLGFEVDDLDEACREVEARGAEISGAPRPRGDGVVQMYLTDPDGYIVELMAVGGPQGGDAPTITGVSREERG